MSRNPSVKSGAKVAAACALLLLGPMPESWETPLLSSLGPTEAHASGGSGSGGGGGGGGGGAYGGGGYQGAPAVRNFFRNLRGGSRGNAAPRRRAAPAPAPPLPSRAPDEIIASGLDDDQLVQLSGAGFAVLEETPVAALDTVVRKLRIPAGSSLEAARAQVEAVAVDAEIDFNHYYRPEQATTEDCVGPQCAAPELVAWPMGHPGCTAPVRVGLIDTGINADHAAFAGNPLEPIRLGVETLPESGLQHGTAVAALLVGSRDSRSPGLLQGPELVAIDAFHRGNAGDDRTDAYTLVRAIDVALDRDVEVLNLSLAGPPNDLLEATVATAAREVVLVAAVGNEGPSADPAYPAAYPGVIGVTAVDRSRRVYRRAGQGPHVDLAAPGVEVWTAASISGARPKTGTSFAAPFVTAAAALMLARQPELSPAQVKERLGEAAVDLGEPGRDPVFGWGLLNAADLCPATEPAAMPAAAGDDAEVPFRPSSAEE